MSGYDSAWIRGIESQDHWAAYHVQISLVDRWIEKGIPVLEIGKGTGMLQEYLERRGWKVRTVDVDSGKHPDLVADARTMSAESFRGTAAILCFETFEHMPFEDFVHVLGEAAAGGVRRLIMSVPFHNPAIAWISGRLPFSREWYIGLRRPRFMKRATSRYHQWELNFRGLTERTLVTAVARSGWRVVERRVTRPRVCQLFLVLENDESEAG